MYKTITASSYMQCISSILTFADYIFPINQQMYFHPSIILFMKNRPERTSPEPANLQPPPKRKQNSQKESKQERKRTSQKNSIFLRYFNLYQQVVSISRARTQDGQANLASYIKPPASTCLFLLLPRRPRGPAMTSQPAGGANPPMASVQELVMSPSQ